MRFRPLLPFVVLGALAVTTLASETPVHAQGGRHAAGAPKKEPATAVKSGATEAAPTTETATTGDATSSPEAARAEEQEPDGQRAIYISADIGFTRAAIGALSDDTGFDRTAANGLLAGVGLGYRSRELRIGARFRDASTTQFNLWALMAEVGWGLKMRPLSPIFMVHAGYMFDVGVERGAIQGSLPAGNILAPDIDLKGLVVGGEVSAMVNLSKLLRVGPFLGVDATFLHRAQVALPQSLFPTTQETRDNPLYSGSGSGVGLAFNLGIRGTGDIAF